MKLKINLKKSLKLKRKKLLNDQIVLQNDLEVVKKKAADGEIKLNEVKKMN